MFTLSSSTRFNRSRSGSGSHGRHGFGDNHGIDANGTNNMIMLVDFDGVGFGGGDSRIGGLAGGGAQIAPFRLVCWSKPQVDVSPRLVVSPKCRDVSDMS